jgi:A/G-specific adenine glycosylase
LGQTQTRTDSVLSAVGEGRPRWKEAPFAGSRRYYRGRIVEALRQLKHGDMHTLSSLGPLVKDGFSDAETLWLRGLLEELAADGLVRLDGDRTALP